MRTRVIGLQDYPLRYLEPPFEGYGEWFRVPERAQDLFEHPATHDDRLTDDAKDLANMIIKLGPRYRGMVPLAAVYLDQQISEGTIHVAINGKPGHYTEVPLVELAARLSSPDFVERMRRDHPEAGLPEQASLVTDDMAAMSIHALHVRGYLVLDDDHVINLAWPPKTPSGTWRFNGHDAVE